MMPYGHRKASKGTKEKYVGAHRGTQQTDKVQEVSKKGSKSEPNGTQDNTKGNPEGHNDALWTTESIKRHERGGSAKRNTDGPRGVFGDEKEANMGPRDVQKGVQIRAYKEYENRAFAAARAQSSQAYRG